MPAMTPLAAPLYAAAVAVVGAALSVAGKIVFDLWQRSKEHRGIAAGLAGEIRAYLDLLNLPSTAKAYRDMAGTSRAARIEWLRTLGPFPSTHPVFDKVADKLGYLGVEDAYAVSRIYNVVTGFRLILANMSSPGFVAAGDPLHAAAIDFVVTTMEREARCADHLIERLRLRAERSPWRMWADWFDRVIMAP